MDNLQSLEIQSPLPTAFVVDDNIPFEDQFAFDQNLPILGNDDSWHQYTRGYWDPPFTRYDTGLLSLPPIAEHAGNHGYGIGTIDDMLHGGIIDPMHLNDPWSPYVPSVEPTPATGAFGHCTCGLLTKQTISTLGRDHLSDSFWSHASCGHPSPRSDHLISHLSTHHSSPSTIRDCLGSPLVLICTALLCCYYFHIFKRFLLSWCRILSYFLSCRRKYEYIWTCYPC